MARAERTNPMVPTRMRKAPTAMVGPQGIQFITWRSIMALVGWAGS